MYKEEKTFNVLEGTVPDFRPIYKEELLNGADPVLDEDGELVPVEINESNGEVKKANIRDAWYKYENKKWANAVILTESGKKQKYKNGQTIPESDIESYFVWIPKYRYKLFDIETYTSVTNITDKSKTIDIKFGIEDTADTKDGECTTPMTSGNNGQCKKGDWMTHPAFISFDVNGFWVGKFETGYEGANSIEEAQQNITDAQKVIIKPNVYSWRNKIVENVFKTSKNYKLNLDSHMMKNTEWGAVAYLAQSIYGTCTLESCAEIRLNNSNSYLTGVAAINIPDKGLNSYTDYGPTTPKHNNEKSNVYPNSKEASTTGNNTGIFDMSGGTWEYVMGYMGENTTQNFMETNPKYYDIYKSNNYDTNYAQRILGDATGELGPFQIIENALISSWNKDYGGFVTLDSIWFIRGGCYFDGINSGIFAFTHPAGPEGNNASFRIVLAPQ